MNIFKKVASKSQTVELSRSERQIAWEAVSATGIVVEDWLRNGKPETLIHFEGSPDELVQVHNKLFSRTGIRQSVAPNEFGIETLRFTRSEIGAMQRSLLVLARMTYSIEQGDANCDPVYRMLPPKSDWPRFIEVLEATAEKLALPEAA